MVYTVLLALRAAGAVRAGAVRLVRVRSTAVAPQRNRGAPRLDECIAA